MTSQTKTVCAKYFTAILISLAAISVLSLAATIPIALFGENDALAKTEATDENEPDENETVRVDMLGASDVEARLTKEEKEVEEVAPATEPCAEETADEEPVDVENLADTENDE